MRDYAGLKALLLVDLSLSDNETFTAFDSIDRVARVQLANSFYKKLCPTGNSGKADDAALKKFIAVNQSLPSGPWSPLPASEASAYFVSLFRDNLRLSLLPRDDHVFDINYIREHMDIGPGAALGADSSSQYTKLFESEVTYTDPFLILWYRAALLETGFWCDAEMQRFQKYGFRKVPGGKIFFATKNAEISRTCCTEANLNMLIQKALGAFIEDRLGSDFGIRLKTQPDYNRELARRGSIDGSFGTIDLVSASDCMGFHLLDRDLPSGFLKAALMISSSRLAVLPDGKTVDLNMVSTMGNGFTFALQTLVFACAVRAAYTCMGFPCQDPSTEFGVFGDDIVVRREVYNFLAAELNALGFQVNLAKSYNVGPFRESCGYDYFNGRNVRGVYVSSLETLQQIYSLINRLNRWSAFHGIRLPHTISLLMSWCQVKHLVPPSEADDAGIHVPFKATKPRLTNDYWFKYRCHVKRVQRIQLADAEMDADGFPDMNSSGIAVGFLSGHISRPDGAFPLTEKSSGLVSSLRERPGARPWYKIASRQIPYWDYRPVQISKHLPGGVPLEHPMERHAGNGVRHDIWENIVLASVTL